MAYIAEASATGRKTVAPTTAGWARIMVVSGKPMAQARSSFESFALVRPVCLAVSVRVWRASNPKVATVGAARVSTPALAQAIAVLQVSSVAVERPVR